MQLQLVSFKLLLTVLISIVRVHGIGVHPKDAWVHGKTKKHWLKDPAMLPAKARNARIMVYNYESYWFGEDAIRQSVPAVASKLLKALCNERTQCPHRPIVFVGHCFGGLVVQQVCTAQINFYVSSKMASQACAKIVH